jgi:hypothetical protein
MVNVLVTSSPLNNIGSAKGIYGGSQTSHYTIKIWPCAGYQPNCVVDILFYDSNSFSLMHSFLTLRGVCIPCNVLHFLITTERFPICMAQRLGPIQSSSSLNAPIPIVSCSPIWSTISYSFLTYTLISHLG